MCNIPSDSWANFTMTPVRGRSDAGSKVMLVLLQNIPSDAWEKVVEVISPLLICSRPFLSTSKSCSLAQIFVLFTKELKTCFNLYYLFLIKPLLTDELSFRFREKIRTSNLYLDLLFWFIYDIYLDYDLCYFFHVWVITG